MKTILKNVKISGTNDWEKVEELKKDGFQEALKSFYGSYGGTIRNIVLWKNSF